MVGSSSENPVAARGVAARAAWAHGVLRRWWMDGRLAPTTSELLRSVVALRLRDRAQRITRRVLPPLGGCRAGTGELISAAGCWRRVITAGDLILPISELGPQAAERVVAVLTRAGIEVFLTDVRADGDSTLAIPVEQRVAALTALAASTGLGDEPGWYLDSARSGRVRVGLLGSRALRRRARRAERWRLYRLHRLGSAASGRTEVVGRDQGAAITFWAPGGSGRREQVGRRGLHRYEPDAPVTVEQVAGRSFPGSAAFPVSSALGRFVEPVDVVCTWVDGADPRWRAELERWRTGSAAPVEDQAVDPARFGSRDELRYSLRSLWLYAGWVRKIFVVTADQVPDWLDEDERLRVVSHREILPPDGLPTFNSHAIEARLHHIDGLAEHFVYVNDDMFLGRPSSPETFFTANGLSRFFESEARVPRRIADDRSVDQAARRGQEIIEQTFGRRVVHKLHHAPYALRRSVLDEIEERFEEVVAATARHRFRHPEDLSIPSAFAHHYGFCTGRAVPGELEVVYENLGSRRLGLALTRLMHDRDIDAFCLNETERWEIDPEVATRRLAAFMAARFPMPSPWER